jgi:hypothetical protein
VSVQAFRGHSVLQTLIRAYFSPAHTTGQRYVYTGSADGSVRIYGAPQHFFAQKNEQGLISMMDICTGKLTYTCSAYISVHMRKFFIMLCS